MAGCGSNVSYSQVTPSKADIVWAWLSPSGCAVAAPCSYYISVLPVPNGTTKCPASTGSEYVPLNTGVAINALSVTDTGEAMGTTVCAIAQTLQNGLVSAWSIPSAPVVMPSSAPIPGAPSGQEKSASLNLPAELGADGRKELALNGMVVWK